MEAPFGATDIKAVTKEFLSPLGGSLSDAWQAIIGDRISHWRLRNAMNLQVKANEEAARLGLAIRPGSVPERYAFAWFEEATKRDEPEIQVLFARLLARAASGADESDDRRLLGLLNEMTPADAGVFQRVYSDQPFPDTGAYSDTGPIGSKGGFARERWPRDWMTALVEHFHPGEAEAAIENLIRIGCLGATLIVEGETNSSFNPRPEDFDRLNWKRVIQSYAALRGYVTATRLGQKLATAVKG